MKSLAQYLQEATDHQWAMPHFNISDLVALRGIAKAAKELQSPVMIGTSEGERKFIGLKNAVAMVAAIAEEFEVPLFLNADHSLSVETAMMAVDYGYGSVHIDLSRKSFTENLKGTVEVVEHARKSRKMISVEGEVGYLVTDSSKIYDQRITIPPQSLTDPGQAKEFVEKTGVDRLAPAVGTLHGIAANTPKIDIDRIKKIRQAVGKDITLVLHGGSGAADNDVAAAIAAGINCVHINTELRVAYTDSLRKILNAKPNETTPYKFFAPVVESVAKKAGEKIKLFGSANKI